MSLKAVVFTLAILIVSALSYGQAARQPQAVKVDKVDFEAQLQTLAADEHTQVQALEAQISNAAPQDKENFQRQIADTKRQGEIHRLEILLNWARSVGDEARASEVEQALNNWRNPPKPAAMPQVPKGEDRASNAKTPQVPGPVNNPDSK